MQIGLYIEISIVGIILLTIILINQRQSAGTSSLQRQFGRMLCAAIAVLVIDAACWLIDGKTFPFAVQSNYFIETWYYFFNGLMPYMWLYYSELALSKDTEVARKRLRWLALPLCLYAVFVLYNLKSGLMFVIDGNNLYHRGRWYFVSAIIAYFYLGYSSVHALAAASRAAWSDERKRYIMIAAFIIPPAIGGIVQMFFFGVTCIWISTVISAVMVYIDMQNRQISTDPLTGLNNRRELSKFLIRETREDLRSGVLALVMMDIDGFKEINDTYGHYYGDDVLVSVAEILKKSCKNTPTFLARFGGDEFCLVYPAENTGAVEGLIEEIQFNVAAWNGTHRRMVALSLSIGYSAWNPKTDRSIDALYKRADQDMYRVKRARKITA